MEKSGFLLLELRPGQIYSHDDGRFVTLMFGFTPNERVMLPAGYTHFGFVIQGATELEHHGRIRHLYSGDFFSVVGPAVIEGDGVGTCSSAKGYTGSNTFGGPIEELGSFRYIDGCTDSLLVPPLRLGDPCLNHLHLPPGTIQTPHTHPSIRAGVVYRGEGECVLPGRDDPVPLKAGMVWVIHPETVHSFNTRDDSLDIIPFHPDSDVGMTDDSHPMINRTIVDGVSASTLEDIRTK